MSDETMLIYRVEREDGTGPYVNLDGKWADHSWEPVSWWPTSPHPTPAGDGIDWYGLEDGFLEWTCGFASLDQLRDWFGGAGAGLKREDFAVSTYRVPVADVIAGRWQVVFRRRELKPVRRRDVLVVLDERELVAA